MLRGRHRGLPAAIDPSVLLPGEALRQKAMEMEYRRQQDAVRAALQASSPLRVDARGRTNTTEDMDVPPGLA